MKKIYIAAMAALVVGPVYAGPDDTLTNIAIITEGYRLINDTASDRLSAQFKMMEDATGQFYASSERVWPHDSYKGEVTPDNSMRALVGYVSGKHAIAYKPDVMAKLNTKPYFNLKRLQSNIQGWGELTAEGQVKRSHGEGGLIMQQIVKAPYGGKDMMLVFEVKDVLFGDAIEAETNLDNGSGYDPNKVVTLDFGKGRFVAVKSTDDCLPAHAGEPIKIVGLDKNTPAKSKVNACYATSFEMKDYPAKMPK